MADAPIQLIKALVMALPLALGRLKCFNLEFIVYFCYIYRDVYIYICYYMLFPQLSCNNSFKFLVAKKELWISR